MLIFLAFLIVLCSDYGNSLLKNASRQEKSKKITFLAFGDSLTAGGCVNFAGFYPFTLQLEKLLHNANISASISTRGLPGEKTQQMISRLHSLISRHHYDYMSILGGTNDLLQKETAEKVTSRLFQLYDMVLNQKSTLIIMTIPATAFDRDETVLLQKRVAVNREIQRYYEVHKSRDRVLFVDLYQTIPFYNDTGVRSANWCDDLHFSKAGYDFIGQQIYETIRSSLRM